MKLVAFTLESQVCIVCKPLAAPHLEMAAIDARKKYYATRASEDEKKGHRRSQLSSRFPS